MGNLLMGFHEKKQTAVVKAEIQINKSKKAEKIKRWTSGDLKEMAINLNLNGRPLPAPKMHPVDWYEGQMFQEEEDADRMNFPWNTPMFVTEKDPVLQRERITIEEIDLESMGVDPNPNERWPYAFAKIIYNILDPEDCEKLLASVNEKGTSICSSRRMTEFVHLYFYTI